MAVAFASEQFELSLPWHWPDALSARGARRASTVPRRSSSATSRRCAPRYRSFVETLPGVRCLLRGEVQPRARGHRRAGRARLQLRDRVARRAGAPAGARARPRRHALLQPGEGARPDRGGVPGRPLALRGRLRVGAVQARAPRARLGDRAAPARRRLDERLPALAQVRCRARAGARGSSRSPAASACARTGRASTSARSAPTRPRGAARSPPSRAARRARRTTGSSSRC